MQKTTICTLLFGLLGAFSAPAATNYVSLQGLHHWPFTNWVTAATNIQAAVDVATNGDFVLVMTGVYCSGGMPAPGQFLSNRVVVTKPITVQSVFGPAETIITGRRNPVTTNGPGAMRGAYLANGACLAGFTITDGHTLTTSTNDQYGGGLLLEYGAQASNCVLIANTSNDSGGGAAVMGSSRLVSSLIISNRSLNGIGVIAGNTSTVARCVICCNAADVPTAVTVGGGIFAFDSALVTECTIANNSSIYGSAALLWSGSLLTRSLIHYNTRSPYGTQNGIVTCFNSGMSMCRIENNVGNAVSMLGYTSELSRIVSCVIRDDQSYGRIYWRYGFMDNCVVVGSPSVSVLEAMNCTFYQSGELNANCILRYNCMPGTNGIGTITSDPMFVDEASGDFRLQRESPCINAGTNLPDLGPWDVAGQPRVRGYRVDIGAYEFSTTGACIAVTERVIDFGSLLVGDSKYARLCVVNLGDEAVVGMATNVLEPFQLVSNGTYAIEYDNYHDILLMFAPPDQQVYSNRVTLLGGGGTTALLIGTGIPEPCCLLAVALYLISFHSYQS
jgi:hypothetical protein